MFVVAVPLTANECDIHYSFSTLKAAQQFVFDTLEDDYEVNTEDLKWEYNGYYYVNVASVTTEDDEVPEEFRIYATIHSDN